MPDNDSVSFGLAISRAKLQDKNVLGAEAPLLSSDPELGSVQANTLSA